MTRARPDRPRAADRNRDGSLESISAGPLHARSAACSVARFFQKAISSLQLPDLEPAVVAAHRHLAV
ncbi:hypothetical protein, partial [Bradyrhizobium sp.]|uniref:hypothetical protein n=1 Tax=Bradyrhizobium sp. TaxID=376 RepID=UPI002908C2F6